MRLVRLLAFIVAILALLAPAAHVLELPNKLRLDGPLWLAVQQSLYAGWGPFICAPTEIGGSGLAVFSFASGSPRRGGGIGAPRWQEEREESERPQADQEAAAGEVVALTPADCGRHPHPQAGTR